VELKYFYRGENKSTNIYIGKDSLGYTAPKILNNMGYFLETPAIFNAHIKSMNIYQDYQSKTGFQFIAKGIGQVISKDRWASSATVSMEREGIATKVVMDDLFFIERSSQKSRSTNYIQSMLLWQSIKDTDDSDELEEISEGQDNAEVVEVPLPLHPFLQVFDLSEHYYVILHVSNLTPYKYDETLMDKLVMPKHKKDLISILIQGSTASIEDIIVGKMKGIIVIATGAPGTGKTLTAEVFSEAIQRPLYVVQCSQLGTSEDEIEKRLKEVMERATRWKAILLIDEADVYIHERGSDIQQNAIVGIFLRVLEYYRGVLFMTSNKATVIDDAILSRATAWLQYEIPSEDELKQIWKILSAQYKIELSAKQIIELVQTFHKISGRAVRNMLKLSKLLAARNKKPVDVELIKYISQFQDIERKEVGK
jgi:hypothetical protein